MVLVEIDYMIQPALKTLGDNSLYRRNQLMITYHKPDLVIGFAPKISECKHTYHLLELAQMKQIPIKAIDSKSLYQRNSTQIDSDPLGGY